MWLSPAGTSTSERTLFSKSNEGSITLSACGSLGYSFGGLGKSSGVSTPCCTVPANAWTHFALVRDFGSMKLTLYVNGIPMSSLATVLPYAQATTLAIAVVTGFSGRIADFQLYNTALTAAAVVALPNNPRSVCCQR